MPEDGVTKSYIIHRRIGENIYAHLENNIIKEVKICIHGLSELRIGQQYCARIKEIDLRLNAAFVDIGSHQAILSFKGKRPQYLVKGNAIIVAISREPWAEKLANVVYIGDAKANTPCPSLLKDVPEWGEWGVPLTANEKQSEDFELIIETAANRVFPLKNGGNIAIDGTRALTAIDIDAGGRVAGGTNQLNFNHKLNKEAALEIARLIRLYNIGGLIVIDFVGAPSRNNADELQKLLETGLKCDIKSDVLPLSRFGLCEINRARKGISILEICGNNYAPSPSRIAINAINKMAQTLLKAKGRTVKLLLNQSAYNFLMNWNFNWQDYIKEKIGGIYEITPSDIAEYEVI